MRKMRKMKRILLAAVLAASMLLTACSGGGAKELSKPDAQTDAPQTIEPTNNVAPTSEKKHRTTLKGGGEDVVTIMVYMCGADLESDNGSATTDLIEMTSAQISDNVNVIAETGGSSAWNNSIVSAQTNQRYKIETENLVCLDENVGAKDMTDPQTLGDFIGFCKDNYPADRYMLIMWDHGCGPIGGYAVDELYPDSTSMSVSEIDGVLSQSGIYFDFIGFDACLMGSFEIAYMLRSHADYFIASEETEPGNGWFYTNWLSELSENSSMPTTDLGKRITDDMVTKNYEENSGYEITLSVVDLLEIENVHEKLAAFTDEMSKMLADNGYGTISEARNNTKEYGTSDKWDMIDLVHFAQNMNISSSKALIEAVSSCVKYTLCSANISNSNGLSIYFPFDDPDYFSNSLELYNNIGLNNSITDFFKSFVNRLVGGQANIPSNDMFSTGDNWNPDEYEADYSQWEDYDWFDSDYIEEHSDDYANDCVDISELEVHEKDDYLALTIPETLNNNLISIQLVAYADDGEGYIELGYDDVYSFDDDGDLIVDYDMTWLAFDGQTVCYYFDKYTDDASIGFVPAYLNDEYVYIYVSFDDSGAKLLGAQKQYDNPLMAQKGYTKLKDGDVIQFTCDYYDYDENFESEYTMGDDFVVDGEIEISYEDVSDWDFLFYYVFEDIYHNYYWSEGVVIE